MRKIYSIVLMACAMLLSTSLFAVDVNTLAGLQDAIDKATEPVEIRLTGDIEIYDATGYATIVVHGQNVTLDLNGHTITTHQKRAIEVYSGSLEIKGTGTIVKDSWTTNRQDAIAVFGSKEDVANVSKLTIGKDVTIDADAHKADGTEMLNAICVLTTTGTNMAYALNNKENKAFGVNIEIKGKVYGSKYGVKINGTVKTDGTNVPYVHVASTAEVYCAPNSDNSTAIYSSGIGKFLIEGYVHGATGVFVKSGTVTLNDAVVKSDYTKEYNDPEARKNGKGDDVTSGFDGGGSAIVVASQNGYAGGQSVTISGDTKVTGGTGYAIDEEVLNGSTKVSNVAVEGGTIEAGGMGAIIITKETATGSDNTITIIGGNIEDNVYIKDESTITNASVDDFTPTEGNYSTTSVTDPATGKTTIVVTKLEDGVNIDETGKTIAQAADAGEGLKWTGVSENIEANTTLPYLEINANKAQVVTVKDGYTLTIGRVVMGTQAQIIVKAGAKLIVDGVQGIVATSNDNIVLETTDGKPAIFLFNPAVTSNRHPNATVEFISKSYRVNNDNKFFQRFGIPATLESIEFDGDASIQTAVSNLNYTSGEWELTGIINGTPALNASNLKKTFTYYQMLTNAPVSETGYKFIMKGALVGNDSPELDILGHTWYGLANSYMGKMNIATLLAAIPASFMNIAVYTYALTGENQYAWDAVNTSALENDMAIATEIDPMQPFLVYNMGARASMATNYQNMVWNPASSNAPARRVSNDRTTAQVLVSNAAGRTERVSVIEGEEYSTPSNAIKYMNEDMNLYVSGDEKYSIVSTDDMNNTYLGFSCTEAGTYTVNFKHLKGESLTLVDLKNGAQVAMDSNASYEFYAEAGAEDYRFVVVKSAKAPTALENAEVAEKVAGVYSITGQYMGTMAEWNTLPAGIYVVNGEKRIR